MSEERSQPHDAQRASGATSAISWPKRILRDVDRTRTLGLAAEMAFWLFLSLLPLAAVLGLVVARLATTHATAVAPMLDPMPAATRELVTRELSRVSAWNGGAVAPVAAIMFVWFASGGIHAIFDALELETESEPRPWWKKRLLAIATCFLLSIAVAALALLGTGLDWIRRIGAGALADLSLQSGSHLDRALRFLLGGVMLVLLHAGLYRVGLPREARRRLPVWPGALFAVVLEVALGFAYGLYLSQMGTESAYQASLSIIAVTLITLWLLSTAVLVGAGLNRQLARRRAEAGAPPKRPSRSSPHGSPPRASLA